MTGKVFWAKVLGDPVPNYNRDGKEWTLDFEPDAEGIALMKREGLTEKIKGKGYNTGKNNQWAEKTPFVRFVHKEFRSNGKPNDPITVCDARNRIWDPDVKIGNETLAEVKFNSADYGKGKPKGLYIQALRILDLKPYVRQEFAPLPEDNEYVQALPVDDFSQPVEVEADAEVGGDPLDDA